jgi:twitching motility two-component system response regulator PilH
MGIIETMRSFFSDRSADTPEAERLPARAPVIPIDRRARRRINARRGTRVLVIDDSRTIVTALRKMLDTSGFVIDDAADGGTGLELARARAPDLIFLDIVMPGLNGFAVLRALRRDLLTQPIPVIMMSGNEQATEQFFGSRIPADDFMKKPFSRQEVFARISGLLDERMVPRRRAVGAR